MSQSVAATMRFDRWCPMKPLTPRIRTRFMWRALYERPWGRAQVRRQPGLVDACAVDLERADEQAPATAAACDQTTRFGAQLRRPGRRRRLHHARFQHAGGPAAYAGERARIRWRDCAHEVVDR